MDIGVLPVKKLDRAKKRLADALGANARAEVARALLNDAFLLCESTRFLTWWVVSDDPAVMAEASRRGFRTIEDPGAGLNQALRTVVRDATAAGATSVTIVPADLPLAWAGDLQDVLDTGATSDVVVVPARDGGTNALYLSPPAVIDPCFGEFSFRAHLAAAEARGVRCSILPLSRLELDIDTIEDVDAYLARPRVAESHTSRVLTALRTDAPPA